MHGQGPFADCLISLVLPISRTSSVVHACHFSCAQDSLNLGARMLPREPYCSVARAAMTFLGDAIMDLLTEDAIPAYNMYALQQLSKDVAKLKAFAEASDVPDMVVRHPMQILTS